MLTDEDIEIQVDKLRDYMLRGGQSQAWFRSKDFAYGDYIRILEASTKKAVAEIPAERKEDFLAGRDAAFAGPWTAKKASPDDAYTEGWLDRK